MYVKERGTSRRSVMATLVISISRADTDTAFSEDPTDFCRNRNRTGGIAVNAERIVLQFELSAINRDNVSGFCNRRSSGGDLRSMQHRIWLTSWHKRSVPQIIPIGKETAALESDR